MHLQVVQVPLELWIQSLSLTSGLCLTGLQILMYVFTLCKVILVFWLVSHVCIKNLCPGNNTVYRITPIEWIFSHNVVCVWCLLGSFGAWPCGHEVHRSGDIGPYQRGVPALPGSVPQVRIPISTVKHSLFDHKIQIKTSPLTFHSFIWIHLNQCDLYFWFHFSKQKMFLECSVQTYSTIFEATCHDLQ